MNEKIVYTVKLIAASVIASSCFLPAQVFGYDSHGRRDPFVPLIGQEKKVRPNSLEDMTAIEDIVLEGIAISPSGKNAAILNGRMVKETDKVGVVYIKNISKKSVELSVNGKDYSLSLSKEEGVNVGGQ